MHRTPQSTAQPPQRSRGSRRETARVAQQLFDGLPHRYDLLAEVLSFGQNRRWRDEMVAPVIAAGPSRVLDVATGPAGVAIQIADGTGGLVTGVDITLDMLRRAGGNLSDRGVAGRVTLVAGNAEELPFPDRAFDALTFTYLLRYVSDPASTLRELARVVRPGGVVSSLEFHVPPEPLWNRLWYFYTRVVLPAAGYVTGGREWYEVGKFLGPSITDHYRQYPTAWHDRAWEQAGIENVHTTLMSLGGGLVMWGTRADW
jgi:demethylmenaquinone methyltransferase/2-methoxy-6-polyprenyl-1,4-benzoquinol methylase